MLEIENRLVHDNLLHKFESAKAGGKHETTDITLADFDGVTYRITNPDGNKSKLIISICLKFWSSLQEHGAQALLEEVYGEYLQSSPEPGFSVSLIVDLTALPEDVKSLASKIALLKRNCFASVFETFFNAQEQGGSTKTAVIPYRDDETMYVEAKKDRVTVVFSTVFKDETDVTYGKVFMQEFKEARRRNQTGPQVLYCHGNPPAELQNQPQAAVGDNIGYVTFVLFPRHTAPSSRKNTIDLIHLFRNYLHYHIKCSKAYIHQRMRAKTSGFLKVLNRARPEEKNKEKKTFSGKTFVGGR